MTFLPFADFAASAASLDMRRLQNQRTEARFVLEWLEQTGSYFDLSDYGAARMWQGFRDALARAATVTMSCRCCVVRHLHRAELQPGATVDCMASARHHERRDSSGWWKGWEIAGRRPRDKDTHASRRGMARQSCERKGLRARAARP